jgi:hypothetical protein
MPALFFKNETNLGKPPKVFELKQGTISADCVQTAFASDWPIMSSEFVL